MPEKTWEPEPLRQAVWKDMPGAGAEQPRDVELQRVLERAEDLGGEMNGVAYTTSGAYSVRRVGASGLAARGLSPYELSPPTIRWSLS